MRANNGRKVIHSRRHDRNDGSGRSARTIAALRRAQTALTQDFEIPKDYEAALELALAIELEEAEARHQSVDELHPRDAEKET